MGCLRLDLLKDQREIVQQARPNHRAEAALPRVGRDLLVDKRSAAAEVLEAPHAVEAAKAGGAAGRALLDEVAVEAEVEVALEMLTSRLNLTTPVPLVDIACRRVLPSSILMLCLTTIPSLLLSLTHAGQTRTTNAHRALLYLLDLSVSTTATIL